MQLGIVQRATVVRRNDYCEGACQSISLIVPGNWALSSSSASFAGQTIRPRRFRPGEFDPVWCWLLDKCESLVTIKLKGLLVKGVGLTCWVCNHPNSCVTQNIDCENSRQNKKQQVDITLPLLNLARRVPWSGELGWGQSVCLVARGIDLIVISPSAGAWAWAWA